MPPWEKYAAQPEAATTGPWARYGGQVEPSIVPQLSPELLGSGADIPSSGISVPPFSPFDPQRHEPRPNPDGSFSTEIEITNESPDGRVWNIPSLWYRDDGAPVELPPEQAQALADRYERSTGNRFPRFDTVDTAVEAAKSRSASGGASSGPLAQPPQMPSTEGPAFNIPSWPGNQPPPSMAQDIAQAGGAGLSRGLTGLADLPQTMWSAGAGLGARAAQALGLATPEEAQAAAAGISGFGPTAMTMQQQTAQQQLADVTGGASEYRGETLPGQFAGTVGEFLPAAVAAPGGVVSNALRYGVAPGLASEAAGQLTEGTAAEPYARTIAALAAGPAAAGAERLGRRVISPFGGADEGRLALAQVLDDAGVPVTAGQRVGSDALRRREGLSQAGQDMSEAQREAFTQAALRTAGTDAKRATPDVLAQTAERIGSVFDDVAKGLDVMPDPSAVTRMSQAIDNFQQLAPKATQPPIIGQVHQRMTQAFRTGQPIPGNVISSWRSNLSKLTTSNDNAVRSAAIEALEAVDDTINATLTASGRADDVARLATAREQYRNFLAIQKAATGAGDEAALGILSPARLRSAVTQQGGAAYAQGRRGDLGELSRAGAILNPLPTSGTAENLRSMLGPVGGSGAGAAIGGAVGGPVGAAIGAVGGAMVPGVVGAARMTRPVQAYLANQLVGAGAPIMEGAALSPVVSALAGAGR